ncbi:MAG: RNA polymerase sigma-54 factor [Rickettsiales bacterium]|nr:RNA polymerase sigma-54 factor [Rickettsiales bacterium]|tara:strand:- start:2933 stop:4384 length:1452 start_codon:yes stop_codon:yes gene_type:complete
MQISQNLKLKQSQSLVMTPQLQQAIKLLQLNNLELSNLINKELEENPFLENESSEELKEISDDKTEDLNESFSSGESLADEPKNDYENRWDTDSFQTYETKKTNYDSVDPGSVLEQTLSEKVNLKSILKSQAQLEFSDNTEKEISELLIDYIEPSGWLLQSIDELESFSGYDKNEINNVLLRMQRFEPSGVFARNLKECLLLQMENQEILTEQNKIIIENLEMLGEGNLKELQKICSMKEEELRENIHKIRLLNPKPGLKYSDESLDLLSPDVIVTKSKNDWSVELNNSTLPKITVNHEYVNEIESLKCSDNDKKFISENINSAKWLLKAIEQRNITTLKISSEIVNQQREFFEKGKKFLKPMILKDVAKKIDMHESTVSRVTSNKLILTPRGIFEMKIFFSASINSVTEGESHSAASVRESLKKLISSEPMNNPLSDEALVSKLQHEGINLARRTVAKYRELLNIPSSSMRRRMMKIQNLNI